MKFISQRLYHIYNRGNNKQPIFYTKENYLFFLNKMRNHLMEESSIFAYCLMPNHFHWLILADDFDRDTQKYHPLNQQICTLLSSYAQAINKQYDRTGSLFQQKTKSVPIRTQEQALICFHYIHQNPIRRGLVKKMGEWEFSSFPDFSGKREGGLANRDIAFKMLKIKPESIVKESEHALDPRYIERIG